MMTRIITSTFIMPEPGQGKDVPVPANIIKEKIQHYLELCDSSTIESTEPCWRYLKALYLRLQAITRRPLSPAEQEVYDMILPVINKYTQDDPDLAGKMEGTSLISKMDKKDDY